jgi:hypothetical protein
MWADSDTDTEFEQASVDGCPERAPSRSSPYSIPTAVQRPYFVLYGYFSFNLFILLLFSYLFIFLTQTSWLLSVVTFVPD